MQISKFLRNINPSDSNNPYNWKIKTAARLTPIAEKLKTREVIVGKSATAKSRHKHHIYDKNLFPILREYGIGTLRIVVSQQKHGELHRILAQCKSYKDFLKYENSIKSENPAITANIAADYSQRIGQLRSGFILYFARIWFAISDAVHRWQHIRKVRKTIGKFYPPKTTV